MTLEAVIDEFLIEQQIRGNSSYTVAYYRRTLGFFSDFVGKAAEIGSVASQDCKRYYLHLMDGKRTSTTVQTYIRALRAFLSWAYGEGYTSENIPARFKLPKAQRKVIDVLTDEEAKRLMNHFDKKDFKGLRNYCICALMLDSGIRMNEAVTLRTGGVHIAEGYVIVNGKGNKQRTVPLGLNAKKVLLRYMARLPKTDVQTPLFVKDTFEPIELTTVKQLFRKLKTQVDIPRLRAHLLRHTFATRYLENGGDVYSLQQILGHTSLEMVKRYVHTTTRKTVCNFTKYSPLDNLR